MTETDAARLWAEWMSTRRVVALTGAGCSTASGIPDYRGGGTARRARNPMRFRDFVSSDGGRQKYWARSAHGWRRVATATPNPAHLALAALEASGHVLGVITQNVDGLHQAAGSQSVVELHGNLDTVVCLGCGDRRARAELQEALMRDNPDFDTLPVRFAPDGDADVDVPSKFMVPVCPGCGGNWKPDVVFFGESVPEARVKQAYRLLEKADALLVVGTSLAVYSGFRFVKRAHQASQPIGIINRGQTRGDELATMRWDHTAEEALAEIVRALRPLHPPRAFAAR